MSSDILDRKGKFYVTRDLIHKNPEVVQEMLSGMIIMRAEMLYMCDMVEYHAMSPDFEVLPCGVMLPEYECIVHDVVDDNGNQEYTFEWKEKGA